MQTPSGRNQNYFRGSGPRVTKDSGSPSVSREPLVINQVKSTRKSSAEINRTVNAFVQQASRIAVDGLPRGNEVGEKRQRIPAKSKRNNPVGKPTPKQIVEMQSGKVKRASISVSKEPSASEVFRKSDQSLSAEFPTKRIQKAGPKEVRISGGPSNGNRIDTNGRTGPGVNKHVSTDKTPSHRSPATQFVADKAPKKSDQDPAIQKQGLMRACSPDERGAKVVRLPQRSSARNKMDYYTSSSSDDECVRPPRGPDAPLSPASKAKMWNDINKSPGPTYPGWKFRSPPGGKHFSQIGPEELTAMFKNLKAEAREKSEEVAPKGPSKFSDYMRKMKAGSKASGELSEASLQQNIDLKKMYAEQLDAMQERAWDSLQALDANLKRSSESGMRTSFDKFMEGTNQRPNRLTVEELAKSRGGKFKGKDTSKPPVMKSFAQGDVVQGDDLSSDESSMMKPPSPQRSGQSSPQGSPSRSKPKPATRLEQTLADVRAARRNLGQGDVLQDSGAVSSSDSDMRKDDRHCRRSDSVRTRPEAKNRPKLDESLSRVTADQFKSLAEKDPLKKLKKISEQLKLDNARTLSRRAPQARVVEFSSSDDDSNNLDVPCPY